MLDALSWLGVLAVRTYVHSGQYIKASNLVATDTTARARKRQSWFGCVTALQHTAEGSIQLPSSDSDVTR